MYESTPNPGSGRRDDGPVELTDVRPGHTNLVARTLRARVLHELAGATLERERVARFEVLERLGAGATSTVFRARDPQLDRDVALKVLHERGTDATAHVLAEARALARLSHPNVVAVYEAGEDHDEVYLVMELMPGQTLRRWAAARSRSWREIAAALAGAGRGLSAAHREGIVHGDFKPDNVLMGDDRRACVADFGMAALAGQSQHGGTRRYMSPERWDGEPASPLADQFAFCTSALELLGSSAPRALRRALRRGSDPVPARRFCGMDAVVAALSRALSMRRRLVLAAAAVGLSVVVGGAAWVTALSHTAAVDRCGAGEARWDAAWSLERRRAVAAVFAAGPPYAAAVHRRLVNTIDHYGHAWRRVHRQVCEATRVHGEQSDSLLDARMSCLNRQLDEFSALTVRLAEHGGDPAIRAATLAVDGLSPPGPCAERAEGRQLLPPPGEPDHAATAAQVAVLNDVRSAYELLDYRAASERAREIAATATHPSVAVRARVWVGTTTLALGEFAATEAHARIALELARMAGDPIGLGDAWMLLLTARAALGNSEDVLEWGPFARLVGDADALHPAAVDVIVGRAHQDRAEYKRAGTYYRRALAAYEAAGRRRDVARVVNDLGNLRWAEGRYDAARDRFEHALAIKGALLGSNHPDLALNLANLGRSALGVGRLREAVGYLRRAVALAEEGLGPDHAEVVSKHGQLAVALYRAGENLEAEALLARALPQIEKHYGATHWRVAKTHTDLGNVALAVGDHTRALSHYKSALGIRREINPDHPGVAAPLANIGLVELQRGRTQAARAALTEARDRLARTLGPNHDFTLLGDINLAEVNVAEDRMPRAERRLVGILERVAQSKEPSQIHRADALTLLGLAQLGQRRGRAAVASLERASVLRGILEEPVPAARTRCALAAARWAVGQREPAVALARQAVSELADQNDGFEQTRCRGLLRATSGQLARSASVP